MLLKRGTKLCRISPTPPPQIVNRSLLFIFLLNTCSNKTCISPHLKYAVTYLSSFCYFHLSAHPTQKIPYVLSTSVLYLPFTLLPQLPQLVQLVQLGCWVSRPLVMVALLQQRLRLRSGLCVDCGMFFQCTFITYIQRFFCTQTHEPQRHYTQDIMANVPSYSSSSLSRAASFSLAASAASGSRCSVSVYNPETSSAPSSPG